MIINTLLDKENVKNQVDLIKLVELKDIQQPHQLFNLLLLKDPSVLLLMLQIGHSIQLECSLTVKTV